MISKDLETDDIIWRLCRTAKDIFYPEPTPQVIAIDIPIGLPDRGARACDLAARKLLGKGRASSVFTAPIRPVLAATNYLEACRIRFQAEGKKMSWQAWNITRNIKEVDRLLRKDPAFQDRVHEVHPEVCFYFLNGEKPLAHNKKSDDGYKERLKLLAPLFGQWLSEALKYRTQLASASDDVLDAFAALWTAERFWMKKSQTIPPDPPIDGFGLRMEIVA